MAQNRLGEYAEAGRRLILFRGLLADNLYGLLLKLLTELSEGKSGVGDTYCRFAGELIHRGELSQTRAVGNPWQNHLLECILYDHNPFTLKASRGSSVSMGEALLAAAASDLNNLERLARIDLTEVCKQAAAREGVAALPQLGAEGGCLPEAGDCLVPDLTPIKTRLLTTRGWEGLIPALIRHHGRLGCGLTARYYALRWDPQAGSREAGEPLQGIAAPEPVRLSDLFGYRQQRERIIENTRRFVEGRPAHNVLLYGHRGTGKSSTVKAVFYEFAGEGLRLVDLPREGLGELQRVLSALKRYSRRFLLFIDDLSFEEHEVKYKELKAVLEGRVERQPDNVLIYATSNRRHLVREFFADRQSPEREEVRGSETVEEKLSLADRFGISVFFGRPDQQEYLEIVAGLAESRGLEVPPAELKRQALQWERQGNIRSGRTARQFVDELAGRKQEGAG